jgi:hypothetical protein
MKTTTYLKILTVGLTLGTLAGCDSMPVSVESLSLAPSPTARQDDVIVTKLEGQPVAFVQERLGLPNGRKDLPTGAMIWTYSDNEKGLNANQCKVALSIRDGVVQRVSIETKSESLFSAVSTSCARIRKNLS